MSSGITVYRPNEKPTYKPDDTNKNSEPKKPIEDPQKKEKELLANSFFKGKIYFQFFVSYKYKTIFLSVINIQYTVLYIYIFFFSLSLEYSKFRCY